MTDPRYTGLSQGDSLSGPLGWIAFIAGGRTDRVSHVWRQQPRHENREQQPLGADRDHCERRH